jgi:hypothetical protein
VKKQDKEYLIRRESLNRVVKWHAGLLGLFVASLLIYEAWNLLTSQALLERWLVIAVLTATLIFVNTASRPIVPKTSYYNYLIIAIITVDIFITSYLVFSQRGMASKAVALFFIPIIASRMFNSIRAIYITTATCAIAYATMTITYFFNNPSEGYKVELYGETAFYAVLLFIGAGILASSLKPYDKLPKTIDKF